MVLRLLRWPLRFVLGILGLALLYLLAAVAGALIPVGGGESVSLRDRELFIRSNGIHLEFVIADDDLGPLWADIKPAIPASNSQTTLPDYWGFGWGEQDFFVKTPTWADFNLWTGVNSVLWQDDVVLRIQPSARPRGKGVKRVRVTRDQFDAVLTFIRSSIRKGANGRPLMVENLLYDPRGVFIEATGTYTPFYTCNEWVNDGLKQAGIGTAAWSPFPQGVMWQLEEAD